MVICQNNGQGPPALPPPGWHSSYHPKLQNTIDCRYPALTHTTIHGRLHIETNLIAGQPPAVDFAATCMAKVQATDPQIMTYESLLLPTLIVEVVLLTQMLYSAVIHKQEQNTLSYN